MVRFVKNHVHWWIKYCEATKPIAKKFYILGNITYMYIVPMLLLHFDLYFCLYNITTRSQSEKTKQQQQYGWKCLVIATKALVTVFVHAKGEPVNVRHAAQRPPSKMKLERQPLFSIVHLYVEAGSFALFTWFGISWASTNLYKGFLCIVAIDIHEYNLLCPICFLSHIYVQHMI